MFLGWVLIDRSGKHFGTILNYIRDGVVPLPENKQDLEELAIEARYFCIDGLWAACEESLSRIANNGDLQSKAVIIIVKCPNAAKSLLSTTRKVILCLKICIKLNVYFVYIFPMLKL